MIETETFYKEKIQEFIKTCNSLYILLNNEKNIEKRIRIEELIVKSEENLNKYK